MEPDDNEAFEGAVFDLELPDSELIQLVKKPLRDAKAFWDDPARHNLRARRDRNKKFWLGKHYDDIDLYEHNVPYMDNVFYESVEAIVPLVTSSIAQPQVLPGNESITSIELARDLEKCLVKWAEDDSLDHKLEISARHLLLKYVGVLKQRFDPTLGEHGEIVTEVIDPDDIVVDHTAKLFENPKFIAERMYATIEELTIKFPEKKEEIFNAFGIKQGRKSQLTRREEYWEVWFTYYDDDRKPQEAVMWLLNTDTVLGKMSTPNWLEESERGKKRNFMDAPVKPYIFINYQNLGDTKIDENAAADQAIPHNRMLNKRGRQIIENGDQAGSGIVYNTEMISKADMARLIGAPDEKIGVKGRVDHALMRVPPPMLMDYVLQDKFDSRNRVSAMFATHAPTKGEATGNPTATQDMLQVQRDQARQDMIVKAIDRASGWLYKHTVQLMKVFYTEEHYFQVAGDNGEFDFVTLRSDDILDGVDVKVVKGSTLPVNKEANKMYAQNAAQLGYIDPLTYHEVQQTGHMPQPSVIVERVLDWMSDPIKFVRNAREDEFNRDAMVDVKLLNAGQKVDARSEPTVEYLNYRQKYMMSGEFQELDDKIKKAHVKNLQENAENAFRILELMQTQILPTGQSADQAAVPGAEGEVAETAPAASPLIANSPVSAPNRVNEIMGGLMDTGGAPAQELV